MTEPKFKVGDIVYTVEIKPSKIEHRYFHDIFETISITQIKIARSCLIHKKITKLKIEPGNVIVEGDKTFLYNDVFHEETLYTKNEALGKVHNFIMGMPQESSTIKK